MDSLVALSVRHPAFHDLDLIEVGPACIFQGFHRERRRGAPRARQRAAHRHAARAGLGRPVGILLEPSGI